LSLFAPGFRLEECENDLARNKTNIMKTKPILLKAVLSFAKPPSDGRRPFRLNGRRLVLSMIAGLSVIATNAFAGQSNPPWFPSLMSFERIRVANAV